jgi:hypothetical protein
LAKKKSELGFVLTQNRQEDLRGKSRKIHIHQPLQAIQTPPKSQTASAIEDAMGDQSECGTKLEDHRTGRPHEVPFAGNGINSATCRFSCTFLLTLQ